MFLFMLFFLSFGFAEKLNEMHTFGFKTFHSKVILALLHNCNKGMFGWQLLRMFPILQRLSSKMIFNQVCVYIGEVSFQYKACAISEVIS